MNARRRSLDKYRDDSAPAMGASGVGRLGDESGVNETANLMSVDSM